MKKILTLGSALWLLGGSLAAEAAPVLVELFTSQGCSSCPPADALLETLSAPGYEIIPLAFHVDYWNHLGWNDPYASPAFTLRQDEYARSLNTNRIFTPQAMVNGVTSLVGSDRDGLLASLKPLKRLNLAWNGKRLKVSGLQPDAKLWVAITEDGLETKIERGENEGRTLAQPAVVRALMPLKASFVDLQLDPAWKRPNLKAVAFQTPLNSMAVLAAGSIALKP